MTIERDASGRRPWVVPLPEGTPPSTFAFDYDRGLPRLYKDFYNESGKERGPVYQTACAWWAAVEDEPFVMGWMLTALSLSPLVLLVLVLPIGWIHR